jgi:hypothetical protein
MYERRLQNVQFRIGKKTTIGLSVLLALSLHIGFLFIPLHLKIQQTQTTGVLVELQLAKRAPESTPPAPLVQPEEIAPAEPEPETEPEPMAELTPEPLPEILRESPRQVAEFQAGTPQPKAEQNQETAATPIPTTRKNFVEMDETQRQSLTSSLLTRQFINDESVTEQLFGKSSALATTDHAAEFHYPAWGNMITMLDQPMPNLPFAYQENLIYFAYDPGVKGDMQRFWDVITPEFGWRTKYGTEVKCIWVLVIAACGWK